MNRRAVGFAAVAGGLVLAYVWWKRRTAVPAASATAPTTVTPTGLLTSAANSILNTGSTSSTALPTSSPSAIQVTDALRAKIRALGF